METEGLIWIPQFLVALLNCFKRLTNVEDIVTPIEKTKEAVEKMLVLV